MELIFDVIAIKGCTGYASDFENNGLYMVDIKTGKSRFITVFPKEEIMITRLHSHCVWIDDKVYFIPSAGKYISIFNVNTNEIDSVEIPSAAKKKEHEYKSKLKFSKAIQHNGNLWLIPATYPGIIKLDLSTNKIVTINNWLPNDKYMFRRAICIRGDVIYAASGNNNNMLIFDLKSETGQIIKIGHMNNGIMDMCENGEDFLMAPRKEGALIKWNIVTKKIKEYCDYPTGFKPGKIVFQCIYRSGDDYVLVPAHASNGIRLSDGKIKIDNDIQWKTEPNTKVELMFETEEKVYLREIRKDLSNRFFYINKSNGMLFDFDFIIINPEERQKKIMRAAMKNREVLWETKFMGLHNWLEIMF